MDQTLVVTTSLAGAIGLAALTAALIAGVVVLTTRAHRRALEHARAAARAEAAEAAAASRARLLIRLDHELKNPLTALRTAAASAQQLLAGEERSAEVEQAVATIGGSSRRIARLLADLRKLADVETREIDRRPVDLAALLELVVDDARTAPGAEDRMFTTSVPRAPWPLPQVRGDEDLLHTALLNLVTNAVKYSADGDTIEVRASEEAGAWVAIEVADTGRGIAEDDQRVVWDELSRGSDVRSIPGSGMGLALVKAIALRHDGRVELRSRPREGTSVRVLIPAIGPAR
ncbi:sensor histidine kinase [Jiangella asiatica]|uniref:histidine kinase n=1 Tax=Jiangella asiatica TaxID=2530372 RepID=A0A4R5DAW6_9ACTN|nr:HAMP domain-containing sensor histidine kinase [Jiangella asiatica]TDE07393.1 HAMP domain-containing histidine kinase [Jiangella asiatica]